VFFMPDVERYMKGKVLSIGDIDDEGFSLSLRVTEGENGITNTIKVVSYDTDSLKMDVDELSVLHEGLKKVYDDVDHMEIIAGVQEQPKEDKMKYSASGLLRILGQ